MSLNAPLSLARGRSLAPVALARLGATLAILALAVAIQVRLGTVDDISWLITVVEKWLSGGRLYVDIVEFNPPASVLLYTPAIALARLVGVSPEFAVAAFGFLAVAVSLGLSALILAEAEMAERFGARGFLVALVALTILPTHAFGERDGFCLVFALPYLALSAARAEDRDVGRAPAVLAGLGLGLAAAVKPPYGLIAILVGLWLVRRVGLRPLLRAPEYPVAVAVGVGYVAAATAFFPAFVEAILPFDVAVYARIRAPLVELLASPGPMMALAMALALLKRAEGRLADPLVATPALAAAASFVAYLVQGKGWLYHLYPTFALLALAYAATLGAGAARPRLDAGAAILAALGAALLLLGLQRWPLPVALAVALAATAVRELLAGPQASRSQTERIALFAEMGFASAFGVAAALSAFEGLSEPALARTLAAMGPRPTVGAISPSLALSHPLVRNVGGVWVQRNIGLAMTAASMRLIGERPNEAGLAERLAPFMRSERAALIADLSRNRPDAILVGELGVESVQAALADPEIKAILADYALAAESGDPDWPAALYLRKDALGLRPAVEAGVTGAP